MRASATSKSREESASLRAAAILWKRRLGLGLGLGLGFGLGLGLGLPCGSEG